MKLDLKTRRISFTLTILTLLIMVCFQALYVHETVAVTTPTVQAPVLLDQGLVPTSMFSIDVTIADVERLVAFDFYVYYNTSVLTGVGGQGYSPFTYPLPTNINDTEGYIHVGASFPPPEYRGQDVGPEPYPVMRVGFSVDGWGASTLDIRRPVFANISGEELSLIVIDGYFANIAEVPHDVAVTDIQVSPTRDVMPGESVSINVTVANQGPFDETFSLTTRAELTTIDSQSVTLAALTDTVISIQWNTWGTALGNYVITVETSVVPGETDTGDNVSSFSDIVILGRHDIAVTSVTASPIDVTQGESVTIEVIVENQGNFTESFSLTAKWGYLPPAPAEAPPEIIIGTQLVSSMAAGAKTTLTFTLDTSGVGFLPPHEYAFIRIRANASNSQEPAVPYEIDTANNWLEMTGYVTVWQQTQPLHDLEAFVSAPSRLPLGDSLMLDATVTNRGLVDEKNVELQLMIDDTVVNSVEIPELFVGSSYTLNYLWTPSTEGTFSVTAYAIPVPDETAVLNNVALAFVEVVTPLHVLFDQTHGCDPVSWYITWIDSLEERGYFIDTWTDGPITSSVLDKYRIFVIPQAHSSYSSSELSAIRTFVEGSGGGLLVIGDDGPSIYTDLTRFAGLFWNSGGVGGMTGDITNHPITEGVNTAYFSAPLAYINVGAPALDLIRDPSGYIMLAASQVGFGKVVTIADEQSIDNVDIVMADNSQLANNIMDWLVSVPLIHDIAITGITVSPTSIIGGEVVYINVTVANEGDFNEYVNLVVYCDSGIVGTSQGIVLASKASDTWTFTWHTPEGMTGDRYTIRAEASAVPGETDTNDNTYIGGKVTVIALTPTLLVAPTIIDTSKTPSSTFSIDITIDDVHSMFGFNFFLYYNTTVLTATYVSSFSPFTVEVASRINDTAGWVYVAYVMPPPEPVGFTTIEPEPIARIDFTVDAFGMSALDIQGTTLPDVQANPIIHNIVDGFFSNVPVLIPPVASFRWAPTNPSIGEPVTFTSTSTDLDGTIVAFDWNWGDETPHGTQETETHTYTSEGTYIVTLTVTDDDGLSNTATHAILIQKEKSTITISASKIMVTLGDSVEISGVIIPTRAGVPVTIQFRQPWDYWWSILAMVPTDENSQYSYEWTPWMPIYESYRTYELRAAWQGDEVTQPAESGVLAIAVIRPPPTIGVDPASGQVGTKVTVKGSYFYPDTMGYLMFDDQLVGFIIPETDGSFNAAFNVPISQAGAHTVKAMMAYYTLIKAEASFTVIDTTPLDLNVDAGAVYFKGETAEFYIQTILNGNPINVTSIKATLYKPDGSTEALAPQKIGTGFYKTRCALTGKGSMTGTYTLKVEASYDTETINADGTSIKTFVVKPTWEREAPRMAAFSIASLGLVSAMVMLWRKEKKKFL